MCNCNKGAQTPAGQQPAPAQPSGPTAESQAAATANARGVTQSFALQTSTGQRLVYGSRLEAEAARVRAGGGTIVPQR